MGARYIRNTFTHNNTTVASNAGRADATMVVSVVCPTNLGRNGKKPAHGEVSVDPINTARRRVIEEPLKSLRRFAD
jgi:hypothetical protein